MDLDNLKDEDILVITDKKDVVKDELYNWFRNRNFYDGLLFNSANNFAVIYSAVNS